MPVNTSKSLGRIIEKAYPFLAIVTFIIAIACIFDTFSLGLYEAGYNIIMVFPVFALALMIFRNYPVAVTVTAAIAYILMYADVLVFSARLTHIRFSDIRLIKEAARVADRYHLVWNMELSRRLIIAVALICFLVFIYKYYDLHTNTKHAFITGSVILILSLATILSGIIPSEREDFDFTVNAERRGIMYSWYCQAKEGKIKAPDGYSKDKAEAILKRYNATNASDNDVNVIVIMNESLADYEIVGTPRFKDPLQNIHKYSNDGEIFEGKLLVSVFGGGTATTEYEFLTGNSMAFLPEDSSPYLQYVNDRTDNLASEMNSEGYTATAIHPYYSEEWNRTQVYNFFGFDRFISGEDFGTGVEVNGKSSTSTISDNLISFGDGPLYVRGLISDQSDYEKVLSETGDKSFIFNVTMQNHGDYDYAGNDFTSDKYVAKSEREEWTGDRTLNGMLYDIDSKNVDEEVSKVNQYLTLSNISDKAFGYLISELERSNKKTIVLMFGDHQPGILISERYVDLKKEADPDYTVPYVLWANYDVDFDAPEYTSPNYLSAILKKNAGLKTTEWDQFRLDMMKEYPVMTANTILDKEGNAVNREELKDYEMIQYMRMFD